MIDIEYDVETVSYYENIKIYDEKGSVEFLDTHEQFATRKYPVSAAKRFLKRFAINGRCLKNTNGTLA